MSSLRATGLRLLLSIGLAFALWIFVSFTQNPDQRSSFEGVPVDIEGLAPGLLIVDKEGLPRANRPTVDITVVADGATLQNVRQSDLRAFVDLSGKGPGENSNVPVAVVPNRSGLARLNIATDPEFLSFRIEQEITRTVPLTVEVTGSVPFSFEAGRARLTSAETTVSTVQVRGPQSRVERITIARVTADIDRLTANYSSSRTIEALAQDGQVITGVTIDPPTVDVLVPIGSSAGIKRVPIVPKLVGSPASGLVVSNVTVEPEFVQLTGGSGSLDNVQSIETFNIDIAGASRAISRTVALNIPANTSLASGEPNQVTVNVQVAPITRGFQVTLPVPVQLVDIGNGLLATLSPQVVQLPLSGTAAELSAFDPASLQGAVSMRGLGEGTYSLAPTFQLPRGITIAGAVPKVTVTLRAPPTQTPAPVPTPTTDITPTATPPERPTEPAEPPTATPAAAPATTSAPAPTEAPAAAPTATPTG